jgi:hypothetical protein
MRTKHLFPILLLMLMAALGTAAAATGNTQGSQVVISADEFVVAGESKNPFDNPDVPYEVLTWTSAGPNVRVLWASSADLKIYSPDGELITAERVGTLGASDLAELESEVATLGTGLRGTAAQRAPILCSLWIQNPYRQWVSVPYGHYEAKGQTSQTCQNHTLQKVWDTLYSSMGGSTYHALASANSGWQSGSSVSATAKYECDSYNFWNWKNWGNGDATGPNGAYYDGPSAFTDPPTQLACT